MTLIASPSFFFPSVQIIADHFVETMSQRILIIIEHTELGTRI